MKQLAAHFAGFDKVDNAQMIQMERLFIAKLVPSFDASTDVPKKDLDDRSDVRRRPRHRRRDLAGNSKLERNPVGRHAVYDATFGQFVRREFFQRLATVYGDTLTPFFTARSQTNFQITRGAIDDLFVHSLANDPEFGAHNRAFPRRARLRIGRRRVAAFARRGACGGIIFC